MSYSDMEFGRKDIKFRSKSIYCKGQVQRSNFNVLHEPEMAAIFGFQYGHHLAQRKVKSMPQICGRPAADLPHTKSLRQGVSRSMLQKENLSQTYRILVCCRNRLRQIYRRKGNIYSLRQGNQRKRESAGRLPQTLVLTH